MLMLTGDSRGGVAANKAAWKLNKKIVEKANKNQPTPEEESKCLILNKLS